MAESFFASVYAELTENHSSEPKAQVRMAAFIWIEIIATRGADTVAWTTRAMLSP